VMCKDLQLCGKYILTQLLQLFWVRTRRNIVGKIRHLGISFRSHPQAWWQKSEGRFTHSMPCPCRAPVLLRQCRVLRESPRGSRKYPND